VSISNTVQEILPPSGTGGREKRSLTPSRCPRSPAPVTAPLASCQRHCAQAGREPSRPFRFASRVLREGETAFGRMTYNGL